MNELLEVIKYILPAGAVMLTTYWLVKRFLEQETERLVQNQKQITSADILKIRLQAYERILLFLERIKPQNLILRSDYTQLDTLAFQRVLLENIRLEYEHNLVQQLYVSGEGWEKLNLAKNWVSNLVKDAAMKFDNQSQPGELAMKIITMELEAEKNPVNEAIEYLKSEVKELF